jgi:hypothetical protein
MPRLKSKVRADGPKNPRAETAIFKRKGKASKIKNVGKRTATQIKADPKGTAKAARDAASSRIKRTKSRPTRFRTA